MIKKIKVIPEIERPDITIRGAWYEEIKEIQEKINEIIEVLNRLDDYVDD